MVKCQQGGGDQMKEFNDFIQYAKEHINEIQYDTVSSLQNEWNQGLTLSKEDVFLITKISNQLLLKE